MIRVLFLIAFSFVISCSSQEAKQEGSYTFEHGFEPDKYPDTIEKWTQRRVVYSGLYNAFEISVTFMNTEVREATTRYEASYSKWSQEKLQNEIKKVMDEMNYDTYFFLSFFTPYAKDNNLSKKGTAWNIYLEANGRRYEGTAVKSTEEYSELVKLYPHYNRWSTPYIVKFRVPTTIAQNGKIKFTLAGPLGEADVQF